MKIFYAFSILFFMCFLNFYCLQSIVKHSSQFYRYLAMSTLFVVDFLVLFWTNALKCVVDISNLIIS